MPTHPFLHEPSALEASGAALPRWVGALIVVHAVACAVGLGLHLL